MSATVDILDDAFPHGTPKGFATGCRGAGCPALISCRDVHTRYSGDWAFKRLIDAGASLEEILARDTAAREGIRDRDRAAARAQRRAEAAGTSTRTTRAPRRPSPPRATVKRTPQSAPPAPAKVGPQSTPADTVVDVSPAPLTTPPTDRSHPGYAWSAERRAQAARSAEWMQRLDRYEQELDAFVRELEEWKSARSAHRHALRHAKTSLTQAQTAESTGLSLNGAIAAAVTSAQEAVDGALAALGKHLSSQPSPPTKPRPPRPPRVSKPRQVQPHGTNACRARGCDRPECIEAGRKYHREWVAARKKQEISSEHHGTAYGYSLGCTDRSKCPAEISCSDASLAEERRRRREAGIAEQAPRVPAEPVRQHVRDLMASGWTVLGIADAADVSKTGLKVLLYGRSGARKGELPAHIEAAKAERVLQLELHAPAALSA
jgi:hypothetical protein